MINVTKSFLPPLEEYQELLRGIWSRSWITNNGPLVKELEQKLIEKLGVGNLIFCNNGTIAIQIAMKALELKGEVITTPFSYVATTNSILWENCQPVFADVNENDFCINPEKVEEKISSRTTAILAVHVYGFPCDVEAIEKIAAKHNLRVIYDAAHAFGVTYKGKSLFNYGDVSTCSFHATKLFHTGEGGAIISNNSELSHKMRLQHMFGHAIDDYFCVGINGKSSELHAAMGLCVLPYVEKIIAARKKIFGWYDALLDKKKVSRPWSKLEFGYNYAYYPVVFSSETVLLRVKSELQKENIFPRRYFYPSLNTLPFVKSESCPVSEDVSARVLSLPLYFDLPEADVERIAAIVNRYAG